MQRQELIHTLASSIDEIRLPHTVRVAIDGVDAAGKTTLADELAPAIQHLGRPVIRASIDGFHRPAAVRYRRGRSSAEGYFRDSFDNETLVETLLGPLGPGGSGVFRHAIFDSLSDTPVEAPFERAPPDAVLLFDGVFLMRPELRRYFDFSIFLRVDFDVTLGRVEHRDLELLGSLQEVRQRYRERYVPGQRLYLAGVRPERWASMVIDNNDPLRPTVVHPAIPQKR